MDYNKGLEKYRTHHLGNSRGRLVVSSDTEGLSFLFSAILMFSEQLLWLQLSNPQRSVSNMRRIKAGTRQVFLLCFLPLSYRENVCREAPWVGAVRFTQISIPCCWGSTLISKQPCFVCHHLGTWNTFHYISGHGPFPTAKEVEKTVLQ